MQSTFIIKNLVTSYLKNLVKLLAYLIYLHILVEHVCDLNELYFA